MVDFGMEFGLANAGWKASSWLEVFQDLSLPRGMMLLNCEHRGRGNEMNIGVASD